LRSFIRRRPLLYAVIRFFKYGPYRGLTRSRPRQELLARAVREDWRMLYLGSGGRRQQGMINLDVTAETGPDIVGDGYHLPFAPGTFDAIFCESVIEHVEDPERFLASASQSLKPGGLWYLEVPFLQPRHAAADFQRWTKEGFIAALARAGLEAVESKAHTGPGFMIAWLLKEWLALILSFGNPRLFHLEAWFFGFVFSPLLLLDPILLRLDLGDGLACAFFHIARRSEE